MIEHACNPSAWKTEVGGLRWKLQHFIRTFAYLVGFVASFLVVWEL